MLPTRIETSRLLLRPLASDDTDALLAAIESSRPELERWMRWPRRLRSRDDVSHAIAGNRAAWDAGASWELGVFLRADGHLVGGVDLRPLNPEVPSFAIAYWLRTSEAGHGYAREAARALATAAFDILGACRVVIACDPDNARSARVAGACGFTREARLRKGVVSPDGEVRDLLIYAMIDEDDASPRSSPGRTRFS